MLDYVDIPVGGQTPDAAATLDRDACADQSLDAVVAPIKAEAPWNARLLGAEPLLHPAFESAVAALRVSGVQRIRVQTGGWGLRGKAAMQRVVTMGVRLFEVRFFSSRRGEHDRLAGKRGSFRVARGAVQRLHRARVKRRAPVFVEARLVVLPDNAERIERILREVSRWPVQQVAVVPGRQPFALDDAAPGIARGIEAALEAERWVYLEGWPACLFPDLELHQRELTRRCSSGGELPDACAGCAYAGFCPGVPDGCVYKPRPVEAPSERQRAWAEFHRNAVAKQEAEL